MVPPELPLQTAERVASRTRCSSLKSHLPASDRLTWLRTNEVNTSGAADKLGKEVRPGTFGKIRVSRLTGVPKRSLCQKHTTCSDLISADPIRPFPIDPRRGGSSVRTMARTMAPSWRSVSGMMQQRSWAVSEPARANPHTESLGPARAGMDLTQSIH